LEKEALLLFLTLLFQSEPFIVTDKAFLEWKTFITTEGLNLAFTLAKKGKNKNLTPRAYTNKVYLVFTPWLFLRPDFFCPKL
jgi:hypothetical protein